MGSGTDSIQTHLESRPLDSVDGGSPYLDDTTRPNAVTVRSRREEQSNLGYSEANCFIKQNGTTRTRNSVNEQNVFGSLERNVQTGLVNLAQSVAGWHMCWTLERRIKLNMRILHLYKAGNQYESVKGKEEIVEIDKLLNNIEQYLKRSIIRVIGVTANELNGNTLTLFNDVMKLNITNNDIDRSHRIGKQQEQTGKAHLNGNCILSNFSNLEEHAVAYGYYVFAATETWLSNAIPDNVVDINSYRTARKDRVILEGGVTFYIKTSLPFTVLTTSNDIRHRAIMNTYYFKQM
ncbi:hypothetical protein ILUMI_24941 [Ignelater luminosus]|uniref:Uncharacterized protein n=1 Tax=Ignelater luminosus TaxID=2038154 RepID=A0A8K0FYA4_IGNLU|nr:hypothetical protein ILUMI_24941 [Ignelater luminosus]